MKVIMVVVGNLTNSALIKDADLYYGDHSVCILETTLDVIVTS